MPFGSFPYGGSPYGGLGGRDMTIEERIEATLFSYTASLVLEGTPPIAWPNVAFVPSGLHLRVSLLPNRNERLFAKGSNPHLRQGILQVTVAAPLNAGPEPATALGGQIAQNFPADLDLNSYGLRVRIQAAPDLSAALAAAAYWEAALSIRYEIFI